MTSSPGLFREKVFRPSGLRIISIVDESYGWRLKMMQTRLRSRPWANGLLGTFGATTVRVPRARLATPGGKTKEWRNATFPAYQRRTKRADALIAGAYLSGTNTRRVRRALAALFGGAVGKDTVSRVWRKTKGDWDVWNARALKEEPIIRLILDGTVVRVRLDKKATSISLLVALGVRADGQKVLLAIKSMGGESEAAWRALLDNLVSRGLRTPELIIVDGGSGLDKALAALWPEAPVQRCTVHKHRNLLAHAPDRMCRFTLIAETGRVRYFRSLLETHLFFAASKLGLEAHFCILEMGLIDWSIDCGVKRPPSCPRKDCAIS